jgi:putative FmdB family regulatory protein
MPLYEYKCRKCGEVFEVIEKFSDEPLKTHNSSCGGSVHRLLSASAFQFKGSGWYVNDYGRGKTSKNGESGSPESTPKKETTTTPKESVSTSADKK